MRLTAADAAAIATWFGLSEPAFRSRFIAASGDRLVDGLGGRCPFLGEGTAAQCTIYPVRPEKCRTWPFWPELLDSPSLLAAARRSCPGIEDRSPSPDADPQ